MNVRLTALCTTFAVIAMYISLVGNASADVSYVQYPQFSSTAASGSTPVYVLTGQSQFGFSTQSSGSSSVQIFCALDANQVALNQWIACPGFASPVSISTAQDYTSNAGGGWYAFYIAWTSNSATFTITPSSSGVTSTTISGAVTISGPVTVTVTNFPSPAPTCSPNISGGSVEPICVNVNNTAPPVPIVSPSPGYTGSPPPTNLAPTYAQNGCYYVTPTFAPTLANGQTSLQRSDDACIMLEDPFPNQHQGLTAASGTCTNIANGPAWVNALIDATTIQTGTLTVYDDATTAACSGTKIFAIATMAANAEYNLYGYKVNSGRFLDYEWTTAGPAGTVLLLFRQ